MPLKLALNLLRTLRPTQWPKNVLVLAAFFFSGHVLFPSRYADEGLAALLGFVAFCLLSGAVYVFNDLRDLPTDRNNPAKSHRPLASGKVTPLQAGIVGLVALAGGITISVFVHPLFLVVALTYLLLNVGYNLGLKHVVILDIFIVSSGFVLRLFAGIVIVDELENASVWMVTCTFFLSLLLATGKRRHEYLDEVGEHGKRRVLRRYNEQFINQLIGLAATASVVTYALYCVLNQSTNYMILTLPLAVYTIARYVYIIYVSGEGGNPEKHLFRDAGMIAGLALYGLVAMFVIYMNQQPQWTDMRLFEIIFSWLGAD